MAYNDFLETACGPVLCYFCIECFVEITKGVNEPNRAECLRLELGSFRDSWAGS